MNDIKSLYSLWLEKAKDDCDIIPELRAVEGNDDEILDRFYKNLEFGTAGLRGIIGAGTNRMNVYTVNQATQGLADYLNSEFESPSVAIAHDSRIKSDVFAKSAAGVLAANGIKVYFYPRLVPTPMLSFAVRRLKCSSGIIITASHNPAKYNGYKCYDPNGYQMTDDAANKTYGFIEKVDMFDGVRKMSFDEALSCGKVEFIGDEIFEEFYQKVLSAGVYDCSGSDLKVIYTPLNGTGNIPVREILRRKGINNVRVVKEQELPDGNFPTCPFPNPEIKQAFELAISMGEKEEADLLLATDPDCDRVGIAVNVGGDYKLMTGNEVGVLLCDYLLSRRKELGTLPKDPIVVKSFVTTSLVDEVAKSYSAETISLLTGFKYIGELITKLEAKGEEDRFIVGMEESYGYLSGTHARDKDAVVASMLICEMACYYKSKGISLYDKMQSLYKKYGMYLNVLLNFSFEGATGMQKMKDMMEDLRENAPGTIAGLPVEEISDYMSSKTVVVSDETEKEINLPKSNVLAYKLPGGSGVIVRPSGTEPKIKVYITAASDTRENALALSDRIGADMKKYMKID
ncbi:MAG: phospho-sugar mutase [Oscillospiraceae bacterium]|nr:phospho-sugar mutase [Oscillospiraceae bacterium]